MGRRWYEDGKFKKKINSFKDFIACAEHLVQASLWWACGAAALYIYTLHWLMLQGG